MRRIVSRILLVALAIAAVVVVARAVGGGRGGAVVALDGLSSQALAHQAFRLDAPARLALDAAGSFEEQPDTALAALGWIVRRADGAVVWRQRPGAHPARGLVSAVRDTLRLGAGTYDAYFASFGDPVVRAAAARPVGRGLGDRIRAALSQGGRAWQGESGRWHLRATGVTAADREAAVPLDDDPEAPEAPTTVWAAQKLRSSQTESTLIRVSQPVTVTVDAVLEAVGGGVADSAAIVRVGGAGDTVWAFRGEGSAPAGGSVKNRHVRARVALAPGLYRAVVRMDGAHAYDDWTANPPWAPWMWGLRIDRGAAPESAVQQLDVEAVATSVRAGTGRLPVLAEARCVGTSQTAEVGFTLTAPVDVVVVAQGELRESEAYDYGTLLLDGTPVWTMQYEDTDHAGGLERNRRAAELLALAPGAYTLRYQTDDSHDCEDGYASGGDPGDPGFWGMAVVALDPDLPASAVQRDEPVVRQDGDGDAEASGGDPDLGPNSRPAVGPRMGTGSGEEIVAFERVGDDARLQRAFSLPATTRVRIVSAGELLPSGPLDNGWIENAQGERVWELTRANSVGAGGQAKNRRFDGVLTLAPGRYTAHYATDDRHAFGGFDGPGPDDPTEWGLRIERIEE